MFSYSTPYINPVNILFISNSCKNYSLAEKYVFQILYKFRIVNNREFFFISDIEKIKIIINNIVDKINYNIDNKIDDKNIINEFILYNEFNLVNDDLPQKLNKKINDDMMLLNIKNKNDFFDHYILSSNRSHQQFEFINNNIQNTNDDVIKLYKNIIIDKFAINDHLSIINFFKTDDYIHKKLLLSNSFDLKNINYCEQRENISKEKNYIRNKKNNTLVKLNDEEKIQTGKKGRLKFYA